LKRKYKIVHIISNLSIGGAQILIFDILSNLMKKEDLDISLITIDSGHYIEKFKNAGINVIDIGEKGLINPKIYFKIKKVIGAIKPDIVHTHLNKADFYGRVAAKKLNVPLIISTCHNYSTTHTGADINRKSFFDIIDNKVIDYSDCSLIAISELVKKYLINRNQLFEKRTEVIYNGINMNKSNYRLSPEDIVKLRAENNLKSDDYVISIIGRLDIQKGHLFFLESVKEILLANSKIKILIIGDGKLSDLIKEYLKENKLGAQVIMKGFLPESEPFIEISDLICVPSLWEGFGLVVTEGEPQNKTELTEKLTYIYRNFTKLDKIKENALSVLKEKFDIAKNSEEYYKYYIRKIENSKIQ